MKAQRLRLRYRLCGPAASLGHRELLSAWDAALHSARLSVTVSEGKRPSPQISIATLLPAGVTSDCELVDVFLAERADHAALRDLVNAHLPDGMVVDSVEEVGINGPSLQSLVRWAEYEVVIAGEGIDVTQISKRIEDLLGAATWPAEYRREAKVRQYDLRPLVYSLRLEGPRGGAIVLRMRLRAEPEMTGRADQVVLALGLPPPAAVHRTKLYIGENQAAVVTYRRRGEQGEEP